MSNNTKTHREVLMRLAEIAEEISQISVVHGIDISYVAHRDGYFTVTAGDYDYVRTPGFEPHCAYHPMESIKLWESTTLDCIESLTAPPIKNAPRSGNSEEGKSINTHHHST